MLTRRRFLGYSSASLLATAAGCRPSNIRLLEESGEVSPLDGPSLKDRAHIASLKNRFLGYPVNMNTPPPEFFSWRKQLNEAGIGTFAYNNVGNPYQHSSIPYNTLDFERKLIERFAKLFGFPAENTWGFLSNSGTDSNMHGMYMGRMILKGRTGVMPKCYFTKEAHYSIQILRDLLGLDTVFVGTLADGSMDPVDLGRKLVENLDHPALVVATIGTTFKGAIDRVDDIQEVLKGYISYLHLDAALFGGYLPHTAQKEEVLYFSEAQSGVPRYDSIAVSCHKFFGFPSPSGLYITTESTFDEFNELYSKIHSPEYIGHVPGTITCSRDAVKPAEFFFFSSEAAMDKQSEDARLMLQNTDYLMEQLKSHFPQRLPTRASKLSNTIYFKKPAQWIVEKYSLATMDLPVEGKKQGFAHVVIMPHVNSQILGDFLSDLEKDSKSA